MVILLIESKLNGNLRRYKILDKEISEVTSMESLPTTEAINPLTKMTLGGKNVQKEDRIPV